MTLNLKEQDKLNLGCGPNAPAGWLNVDGSWNAWLSKHPHFRRALQTVGVINSNQGAEWKVQPLVHDLTKSLPFPENIFSAVYASHILEHLYLADAQRLLSECMRVLKPRGTIRLVVPDLRFMVEDYLNTRNGKRLPGSDKASAADHLNERLGFRRPVPPGGNLLLKFYALSKDFHSHKWMYDSDSLCRYMEVAGFEGVVEKGFRQSDIPGIDEVEHEIRVLGGEGICVEGKKPGGK
jgi:SAM-dependent methyltransferase